MYNKFKSHEGDDDNFLDIQHDSMENKMKNQTCMDLGSGANASAKPLTGESAPAFSAKAWWKGYEADLTLEQFIGQYVVIFFDSINMDLDELEKLSDRVNEF